MDSAGLCKCLPDCTQSCPRQRMRCYQTPDSFTENHTPDVTATLSPIRTKCRGSQPLAQETSHDTHSPPHLLLPPYSGWCSRLRLHIGIPDRLLSEMSVKRNLFFLNHFSSPRNWLLCDTELCSRRIFTLELNSRLFLSFLSALSVPESKRNDWSLSSPILITGLRIR